MFLNIAYVLLIKPSLIWSEIQKKYVVQYCQYHNLK